MKVPKSIGHVNSWEHLHQWIFQVGRVIQGGISFGVSFAPDTNAVVDGSPTSNVDADINIKCFKAAGTTPGTANTTFTITSVGPAFFHDQHIPIGVIVVSLDTAGAVISTVTIGSWTKGSISLSCSAASVNYRVIII